MRTPALIFDFGNVVAHFDYRKACATLGRSLGLSGDELLERVRGLGFVPLVRRYESGGMSAEAFSRALCEMAGLSIPHDQFAAAWSDIFWLNEPVAALIAALKRRGYTLVLGSNTNDLHAAQFRRQFAETLAHFDRLVLSFEVGHVKPSAEFYHTCAEAAGAEPSACIFIDDLPENVAGARAAGLIGLHFQDVPTLKTDLRRQGVEVPED
ncbi:MAG: HAD family phosphatase [Isosphaeraceae bacterium]|nr:HAD family phosphatase [Isosphaeraceae bacterium]